MVLPLPPPLRHRQPPITPESLPAAIPEPDQRPPLTAATHTAATITQQHRQQLIETKLQQDHAAKINDNTAAKSQQHLPQQFWEHRPPHRLTI
jgi:hypothetical protein